MASRIAVEVEVVERSPDRPGVAMFHVKTDAAERWLYRRERGGWQSVQPPQDDSVEALGEICAGAFPELV